MSDNFENMTSSEILHYLAADWHDVREAEHLEAVAYEFDDLEKKLKEKLEGAVPFHGPPLVLEAEPKFVQIAVSKGTVHALDTNGKVWVQTTYAYEPVWRPLSSTRGEYRGGGSE